jgi:hypothetical protein
MCLHRDRMEGRGYMAPWWGMDNSVGYRSAVMIHFHLDALQYCTACSCILGKEVVECMLNVDSHMWSMRKTNSIIIMIMCSSLGWGQGQMRSSEITMALATGDSITCHKSFIMLVLNVAWSSSFSILKLSTKQGLRCWFCFMQVNVSISKHNILF